MLLREVREFCGCEWKKRVSVSVVVAETSNSTRRNRWAQVTSESVSVREARE